jgi:hypothetical protein
MSELAALVRSPAPEDDVWIGRAVADWISQKLGRPVSVQPLPGSTARTRPPPNEGSGESVSRQGVSSVGSGCLLQVLCLLIG